MQNESNALEKIGTKWIENQKVHNYLHKKGDSHICREDPASDSWHSTHCFLTVKFNQPCVLSFIVIRIGNKIRPRIIATMAKTKNCTWRQNTSYTSNEQITTRLSYTTVATRLNCEVSLPPLYPAALSLSLSFFLPLPPPFPRWRSERRQKTARRSRPYRVLRPRQVYLSEMPSSPTNRCLDEGGERESRRKSHSPPRWDDLSVRSLLRKGSVAATCISDVKDSKFTTIDSKTINYFYFSIFMMQILNCLDFNIKLEFLNVF